MMTGCGSVHVGTPREDFELSCIQGTIWYRSPVDGTMVRYPDAQISAWRHGEEDEGLAETRADSAGNYCLEVPLGEPGVDIRVFWFLRLSGKSYRCRGSKEKVDLGQSPKTCGEDCITIDIITDCQEFEPRRHRQI
jgi:hypothetical protein